MKTYYVDSIHTVSYGTDLNGSRYKDIVNLKMSHLDAHSVMYPVKDELIVTQDDDGTFKYHPSLKKEYHDLEFKCHEIEGV